jgi:glycerol-3-phosphate O-acyltransferase
MQMLTQRLSLLFEFAPPDFYERSTFASHVDNLIEAGIIAADADGRLHLDQRSREWRKSLERLLPADAVFAIRRIATHHGNLAVADSASISAHD